MNSRNLDRIRFFFSPFLVLVPLLLVMAAASGCRPETLLDISDAHAPVADEVVVSKVDLGRLTGSYANKDMGFAFQLDLQGKRLRLTITEGPQFAPALLIPTSVNDFRWEGPGLAPGLRVSFQMKGDTEKATSLTVIQPGMPLVVMRRVSEKTDK